MNALASKCAYSASLFKLLYVLKNNNSKNKTHKIIEKYAKNNNNNKKKTGGIDHWMNSVNWAENAQVWIQTGTIKLTYQWSCIFIFSYLGIKLVFGYRQVFIFIFHFLNFKRN